MIAATAVIGLGFGSVAFAHDEIDSSVPSHQSQFDDPISEVFVDFGESVSGVEMALVDPDNNDLPAEVVVLSDTEAKLVFDPLADKGEYIVRYLAEEDGHLIAGAISFVYGERAGSGAAVTTWILFGLAAALILAVGAFFSLRRSQAITPAADDALDATV